MTGVETEIKLLASPAMLDTLRQHPLLAGEERTAALKTRYFDTPDGRLQRAGASLRLRGGDGRQEQTFKQPLPPSPGNQAGAGVSRSEWTAPVTGDRPDPAGFPPPVAAGLARQLDGAALTDFATITVTRHIRRVHHGGALIEVAFDQGEIAAADRREPICECELELVEGSLADLLGLALELPLSPDLRWSVQAKGERAFALGRGDAPGPVRAATVAVTPAMSVRDAFRTICWSCLDHLLANYGLVIAGGNNEALHQCRVAIRRLRAALGLFAAAKGGAKDGTIDGAIDTDAAARFRAAWRDAASAMGEARELHVLLLALEQAGAPASVAQEDRLLLDELSTRRDAALAAAGARLGSGDFQRLLFEFACWIEATGDTPAGHAAPQTLPEFAAGVLDEQRRKVKHAGRHIHDLTDDELHRLRIKVKKLRYAVEFFAGHAARDRARAVKAYGKALGKLQEQLGDLHDLSERTADSPLFAAWEPERRALLHRLLEQRLGASAPSRDRLVEATASAMAKILALPRWWHDDSEDSDMPQREGKHGEGKHTANDQLPDLQIRLTSLQRQVIARGQKLLIIFEGRDAAGKDGTIKRITEHMSPRDTRVVAMGVPSERDRKAWYFQRYVPELPVSGEIVLFNRSWYNRAGVERVMGFCSDAEYEEFMANVVLFEQLLLHSGFTMIKYYLDISKDEQKRRLRDRETDPLKQWKISPIDKKAHKLWDKYSAARDEMLARTHTVFAPWVVVKADDKRQAHLAVIRDILARCGASDPDVGVLPDPSTAFVYDAQALERGWLAK